MQQQDGAARRGEGCSGETYLLTVSSTLVEGRRAKPPVLPYHNHRSHSVCPCCARGLCDVLSLPPALPREKSGCLGVARLTHCGGCVHRACLG